MTCDHSPRRIHLSALIPALAATAAIAVMAPGSASARDTYVDHSDGSDSSAQCRRANPCATISRANAKAGRGDTIFVGGDPVAFTTPVTLGKGKSLVSRDFSTKASIDTSGTAELNSGADPRPAVTVASNAGTIKGMYIGSQATAIEIHASVTVDDAVFLGKAAMSGPVIDVAPDAHGRTVIRRSSIHDFTPGGPQIGIRDRSRGAPLIAGNSMSGFTAAITTNGRPTIRGNEILDTHTGGGASGAGIVVRRGEAAISHNWLSSPDTSGTPVTGMYIRGDAHLEDNVVRDYDLGIELKNTPHPVDLTGDVIRTIAGSGGTRGLAAIDDTDSRGVSDPHATNITIVGPGTQMALDSVRLRLDSSIIGDTPAGIMSLSGGSTCKITYSRGPVMGNSTDGCANFQTKEDPVFGLDGYHLEAASPLIDKGNPKAAAGGAKDLDGDRRALDGPDGGSCDDGSRRDIGADEYAC
jgi:hypothetical protein